MNSVAKPPAELRGVHVLWMILAFFGVVIAVNVAFAVMAVRSFPGEDVRRSYLQGLHYNETLSARRAQSALGWRASASLGGAGENAALEVVLVDRAGAPLRGVRLAGVLQWPTTSSLDRELAFAPVGDGHFTAPVTALRNGRWRLRAHAENEAGEALDFESELTWPARH